MERQFSIEQYFKSNLPAAFLAVLGIIFAAQFFVIGLIFGITFLISERRSFHLSVQMLWILIPYVLLLVVWIGIRNTKKFFQHHAEVTGKITQTGYIGSLVDVLSDSPTHGIRYTYSYNGQEYMGVTYIAPIPKELKVGDEVAVYLNPEKPDRSILPDLYCKPNNHNQNSSNG